MRRVFLVITLPLMLTACTVSVPAAQSNDGFVADFGAVISQPPPAYGTNVWWTDQDAAVWTERWAELGPSLVRLFVFHGVVEPVNDNDDPNTTNWSGFLLDTPISIPGTTRTLTYRAIFEALRDQPDLRVMIYFPYLAPWLSDNPPQPGLPIPLAPHPSNDLAEYREFVEVVLHYMVDTLDFPPERIMVEAMNEPDLGCGADPMVACFWQDWTMDDVSDVVRVTYEAIQAVDAEIPLIGLAECCGTSVVRSLLGDYPEGAYLDGLSYHYYSPSGYNLDAALSRKLTLAPYDLPIYLDEYGSRQYLSEGADAALWHSWALTTLWEAGIAPLQYPISKYPWLGEPYNSMGLLEDWRGDWERKPSYWVYANFSRTVSGGEIISHTAPPGVDVLTTRRVAGDEIQATFWVVNRSSATLSDQVFVVYGFPRQEATLHVYDNLVGPAPVLTATVSGSPLAFTTTLPARSSRALVLSGEQPHGSVDHVLLGPRSVTRLAGQTPAYALTAYDANNSKWDVITVATYAVDADASGNWIGNRHIAKITGTRAITGHHSQQSDAGVLAVWAAYGHAHPPLALREHILP